MNLKGLGTKSDPYEIYTEDDLIAFRTYSEIDNPDKGYELMNDIQLTKKWTPIGTMSKPFSGYFNGNGFTISNVKIDADSDAVGFFGRTVFQYKKFSGIFYLKIEDVEINQVGKATYVGGLIGYGSGGYVIGCSVENIKIRVNSSYAGGLIGLSSGYPTPSRVNISKVKHFDIDGKIEKGSGFIADMEATYIEHSGVIGRIYFGSSVSSATFFAHVRSFQAKKFPTCFVATSERQPSTKGSGATIPSNDVKVITGDQKNPSNYSNYYGDIIELGPEKRWNLIEGNYPYLTYFGTPVNPIEINDYSDIGSKMMNPDYEYGIEGSFILMNDVKLPRPVTNITSPNWSSSGDRAILTRNYSTVPNSSEIFRGYFDGNGYSIGGLEYSASSNTYNTNVSLFREVEGATIKNLSIEFDKLEGTNRSGYGMGVDSISRLPVKGSIIDSLNVSIKGAKNLTLVKLIGSSADDSANNEKIHTSNARILIDEQSAGNLNPDDIIVINQHANSSYDALAPILKNIMVIIDGSMSGRPSIFRYTGGNQEFLDNTNEIILNILGDANSGSIGRKVTMVNREELLDGQLPVLQPFIESGWKFDGISLPIQVVFDKVTEKIEEFIVSSYSKINTFSNKRFKGKRLINKHYSKKFKTMLERFKARYSIAENYSSALKSSIERGGRVTAKINNIIKPVISLSDRTIGKIEELNTHLQRMSVNVLTTRVGNRNISNYSDSFIDKARSIKSITISISNYVDSFMYSILKQGIRKYKRYVSLYSDKIQSKTVTSVIKRYYRTSTNHMKEISGYILRESNIAKFGREVIINSVGPIGSKSIRSAVVKRVNEFYSQAMATTSKGLRKVSDPVQVFAYLKAQTNKVKLRILENKTVVKNRNKGGGR